MCPSTVGRDTAGDCASVHVKESNRALRCLGLHLVQQLAPYTQKGNMEATLHIRTCSTEVSSFIKVLATRYVRLIDWRARFPLTRAFIDASRSPRPNGRHAKGCFYPENKFNAVITARWNLYFGFFIKKIKLKIIYLNFYFIKLIMTKNWIK